MGGEREETYYCTRCGVEVSLARVCPKCHSRASLVPLTSGGAPPDVVPPTASRGRWLAVWIGLGLLLAGGLATGFWWALRSPPRATSPKEPTPGTAVFSAPRTAGPGDRVFGRPSPPRRLVPPPPPRICGKRYHLTVQVRFAHAKTKALPRKATPRKAAPRPAPRSRPARKTPDLAITRQRFLLAGDGAHLRWVLLAAGRELGIGDKRLPVFRLDRQGALLPDPRRRRLVQRKFHEPMAQGLRPSDLVGRALAQLGRDPAGGLVVRKLRRSERWVRRLVGDAVAVVAWLTPRPPKPRARRFSDDRVPPPAVAPGIKTLRRWLTRAPHTPAQGQVRYRVTTPPGGVRVTGTVDWRPGAPLPARAKLRLTKLPAGKVSLDEMVLELVAEGSGCNRK